MAAKGAQAPQEPPYIPGSQSLAETAQNLANKGKVQAPTQAPGQAPGKRPILKLRGSVSVVDSLHPDLGAVNTGVVIGSDMDGASMELDIFDEMMAYDHNPRRQINPAFPAIKEALRASRGLDGAFTVTRRPGEKKYIPYRGQNTRFAALVELYEETKDPCFRKIKAVFKTWVSESSTLLSHIAENEVRGNTSWFDKAYSIVEFWKLREKEAGHPLNAADIERQAKDENGMVVPRRSISLYEFAVKHFYEVGNWLTKDSATTLRNWHNTAETIAQKIGKTAEFASIYGEKYPSILQGYRTELDSVQQQADAQDGAPVVLRDELLERLLQDLMACYGEAISAPLAVVKALFAAGSTTGSGELLSIYQGKLPEPPAVQASTEEEAPAETVSSPDTPPQSNAARGKPATQKKRGPLPESSKVVPPSISSSESSSEANTESSAGGSAPDITTVFETALTNFSQLTHLQEFVCSDPDLGLPYGFWLDCPAEVLEGHSLLRVPAEAELSPKEQTIRLRAFRVMAHMSGQLGYGQQTDREFAERLASESLWRQIVLVDEMDPNNFLIRWQHQFLGAVHPMLSTACPERDDYLELLIDSKVGAAFTRLLDAFRQWGEALQAHRTN